MKRKELVIGKKFLSIILSVLLIAGILSCATVTVGAVTYTCGVGKTKQLSDTNYWGDGSTTTKTWTSSNTNIARIQSSSGSTCQVYGVSVGKVTITCNTYAQKWVGDSKYGYMDTNTTTKNYDLEVVDVDNGSGTSSTSGFDRLKNYLLSYGKEETLYNGDVMYDVNWTNSDYTYHINYVPGESDIFFGCTYQDTAYVNFGLNVSSGTTATCTVNYGIVPQVSASINKADYKKGQSLNFKVDYSGSSSSSVSDNEAIQKSSTLFNNVFPIFDTYITQNMNVSMIDLGFTSYNTSNSSNVATQPEVSDTNTDNENDGDSDAWDDNDDIDDIDDDMDDEDYDDDFDDDSDYGDYYYPSKSTKKKVVKKKNTIKVTAKTKTVKRKKLKKKAQTVKPLTIKKAKGKVTCKLIKKGTSKKIFKYLKINNKGKITIKKWKKAKKGTYKIKVRITAKGNKSYKSKTVTKTAKIKIK